MTSTTPPGRGPATGHRLPLPVPRDEHTRDRERARDEERDREVAAYRVAEMPRHDLDDLAALAVELCHVPAAAINLMRLGSQDTVAAYGTEPGICTREDSMCNAVLYDGRPVRVRDASLDPRWAENPYVTGELNRFRFYCAHQLVSPRGVVIGTLCVFDYVPRDVDDAVDQMLETIAHRVVDLLELRLRTRELEETVADLTLARSELERSNELLGLFAAQVAHDLRGPIGGLAGSLEMLGEGSTGHTTHPGEGERQWLLERAVHSLERMDNLVADMLAFASVGGGVRLGEVDLAALVPQVLEDLAGQLAGTTVDVGPLLVVVADRTHLRVVVQNLVANAAKFSATVDRPLVRVSAGTTGAGWWLEVADNGPGIPAGQRERMFGLLVQGDEQAEGLGLGLATCRRIVEAHGGEIRLDVAPEGGALVRVDVPGPT